MNLAIVIGIALAVVFAALGAAKVAKTSSMRTRAEHVGLSAESYQLIGLAEVLGALGVMAGLVYAPVSRAAGAGLIALLVGAVGAHLRSGDRGWELAPAIAFAGATAVYLLALGAW